MPDYLSNTQALDDELGFGWGNSVNYSDLYNSQHPDSRIPRSNSQTANPNGPANYSRAAGARSDAALRSQQAYNRNSGQGVGTDQLSTQSSAGLNPDAFSRYLNPAAVSAVYRASRAPSAFQGASLANDRHSYSDKTPDYLSVRSPSFTPPVNAELANREALSNAQIAEITARNRRNTFAGSGLQPDGTRAPQQADDGYRIGAINNKSTADQVSGQRGYQDYLSTIQQKNAQFQTQQKAERQQRLRGSLLNTSAGIDRRGMPYNRVYGRQPTENELAYA